MIILSIFFFITAILYSSVGFGGGSTYLALMLIWDIPYYIFPIIALFCNIIVVSGNSINYIKSGNLNLKLLTPYLLGSIPFAFIGASISIEKELFEILLFFVLFIAGIFLLIESKSFNENQIKLKQIPKILSIDPTPVQVTALPKALPTTIVKKSVKTNITTPKPTLFTNSDSI